MSSLIILFSELQAACGLKLNPRGAGTEIIQNQIYVKKKKLFLKQYCFSSLHVEKNACRKPTSEHVVG